MGRLRSRSQGGNDRGSETLEGDRRRDPRRGDRGFDPELGSFVQAYGSKRLDASLLPLSLVGFLPAMDPRVTGTLEAIEQKLVVDGEFVLRYEPENTADGLPPGEGAFLACSFWLVDNYILQGATSKRASCLNGCCPTATMLASSPRSSIRALVGCWAISRKPTATLA